MKYPTTKDSNRYAGIRNTVNNPVFEEHATALGQLLAEKNITVIYGGGNEGLMAAVANGALEKKGKVIGIIPEILSAWERQHNNLTELHVVDNMHTRKQMLYDKCDAAIILPGGFGTLDEVFEMLTWNQLNIHNKKMFFLNSEGFYDHLVAHIRHMHKESFLYDHPDDKITVLTEPRNLANYLQ